MSPPISQDVFESGSNNFEEAIVFNVPHLNDSYEIIQNMLSNDIIDDKMDQLTESQQPSFRFNGNYP